MVESYPNLYETFRWHVPKGFNLANACCFQWSNLPGHEQRPALIHQSRLGNTEQTTFAELGRVGAQLANGLVRLGVIPGDRVVLVLQNPADLMAALIACWAIRAVAVPLPPGSDADLLLPRIKQARSQIALIDAANQAEALAAINRCPRIKHIVGIDVHDGRVMSWRGLIARQPDSFVPTQALPSDPALMIWPNHPGPALAAQSALVLSHQCLIGQLPGFVMATNWFPENGKQLLTTLKPWDEAGLLAAILPTLYFGHTVVLTDRFDLPAHLPTQVTHVVSTGRALIDSLKSDFIDSPVSASLAAVMLLDNTLDPGWHQQAQDAYGVAPNLATFVSGSGLLIAQCQQKWPEIPNSSGRLVPGHQIQLVEADGSSLALQQAVGELTVSRVDALGHTDPAQFIQVWPVKDALDLSVELPTWWRTGLSAQSLDNNQWRVLGYADQWQTIADQPISMWQLEQAVLLAQGIKWAEVAFIPNRKLAPTEVEIWVLLDTGPTHERQLKPWRHALRQDITDRILTAANLTEANVRVRPGLVDRQAMSSADRLTRSPWNTRAYQALIDFL